MEGGMPPTPEPRTIEEDACWARDNMDFKNALYLFEVSAAVEGQDSPRVHLNLGYIHFHALGDPTGNINLWKTLWHFNKYIQLTEPNYLHFQILRIMDTLVKELIKFPEYIPCLKELGFIDFDTPI